MSSETAEPAENMSETATAAAERTAAAGVNYDSAPVVEVTVEDTDYRLDAGKQGTALCISSRPTGTWDWQFDGEARWDGSALRSRAFERKLLLQLSQALTQALAALD